MAQAKESVYLPPLSACLSGEKQLISWGALCEALSSSDGLFATDSVRVKQTLQHEIIQQFLSDPDAVRVLSHPLRPFDSKSPASKNAFDTATAPIKVTPSETFSIIVEDAQWLSQQLNISELASLRLALLEWQREPQFQLASGLTEEEAASVQQVSGVANFASSLVSSKPLSNFATSLLAPVAAKSNFSGTEQRHKRLLELFLTEKLHILRTTEIILRARANRGSHIPKWITNITAEIENAQDFWIDGPGGLPQSVVERALAALENRIRQFDSDDLWTPAATLDIPDLDQSWRTSQVIEMIHILEIFFTQTTSSKELPLAHELSAWFDFVGRFGFFQSNLPASIGSSTTSLFQLLISVATLAIFKLDVSLAALTEIAQQEFSGAPAARTQTPWFLDSQCVLVINQVLHHMATQGPTAASPVIFAWTVLAQRLRSYTIEIQTERDLLIETEHSSQPIVFEEPLRIIIDTSDEIATEDNAEQDQIERLARIAVDYCRVFDTVVSSADLTSSAYGSEVDHSMASQIRLTLLNLLRETAGSLSYSSPLILAIVEVLTERDTYWDVVDSLHKSTNSAVLSFFEDDQIFRPMIVDQALVRYPNEIWPLGKIIRSLLSGLRSETGAELIHRLRDARAFTQTMPLRFVAFEPCEDEISANAVQLIDSLPLFVSKVRRQRAVLGASSGGVDEILEFTVLDGTKGDIVSADSNPKVATWYYRHSALQYLAKLLSTATGRSGFVETSTDAPADLTTASEIIGLFASVLASTVKLGDSDEATVDGIANAISLLEELDAPLEGQDITSVVFEIFDNELQKARSRNGGDAPFDLFVNCGHFIHALTTVHPNKVWSYLARSRLLDFDDISNSLANGVIGVEAALGRYDFLITLIRIFETLIEDVVATAVTRKESSRALTRFSSTRSLEVASPKLSKSKVVITFTKIFTAVLESIPDWKFSSSTQESELTTRITEGYSSILNYVYGFNDTSANHSFNGPLEPAAQYLVDVYLSQAKNDLPVRPFLNALSAALKGESSTLYRRDTEVLTRQTLAILRFSIVILRVGLQLDLPRSYFEARFFKALPLVTRLYSHNDAYQSLVVKLLHTLVESSGRTVDEPPSLLGHLGSDTVKNFLAILALRGEPMNSAVAEKDIWNFLSAVIRNRQQWLSIYMLTGHTPKETLRSGGQKATEQPKTSMLAIAMRKLHGIKELPTELAIAILQFVSIAQDHFPFAVRDDASRYREFIHALRNYLSFYRWDDRPASLETKSEALRVAAMVTEMLAMDIYQQRQMGVSNFDPNFFSETHILREHGVAAPQYNHALHANLRKNLETTYPGCTLDSFKHTSLTSTGPGSNFYYDLDFAKKVLGSRQSRSAAPDQSFLKEFELANINLSFVESQILLLKSWKLLATELSISVLQRRNVQTEEQKSTREKWTKAFVRIATDCLRANMESEAQHPLFTRLTHVRAEFAFVLIKKLVEADCKDEDSQSLLLVTWDAIRSSGQDLEAPFDRGDVSYYRTLLRILFLCLQPNINNPGAVPAASLDASAAGQNRLRNQPKPRMTAALLEILSNVISKGFRSLSIQLHEGSSAVQPPDFVLLTALLQSILRIPVVGSNSVQSQIATAFAMNETSRSATTLFSWADRLAAEGDPIYGELSIMFLLELSTVPAMAEQLAVDGVLAQISNANLVEYFRLPQGRGPFDAPTRMYSIWHKGFLPLCLNLLYSVGPPVAGEVATFLNQFASQLARVATWINSRNGPTAREPRRGQITLSFASEVHSLSLIELVLSQYRAQGPAVGVLASEIPELEWDQLSIKEDVEAWLQGRKSLRDRIGAGTEKEAELMRLKAVERGSLAESRLEEKIVSELQAALECLNAAAAASTPE